MSNFREFKDDRELEEMIRKAQSQMEDNLGMQALQGEAVQSGKNGPKKVLKKIHTIEQMVLSYEAAKALRKIRKEVETEEINRALGHLPKLEIPYSHEETERLYRSFAKKVKMNPVFVYTAKIALEDMFRYGFDQSPSVTKTAMRESENLTDSFGSNNVQKFMKITLFDHTLHVFAKALERIDDLGRISGKEPAILAALLHDFGKAGAIREDIMGENVGKGYKAHQEVSSMYVKTLLANKVRSIVGEENFSKDVFDLIAKTVERHHSKSQKDLKDSFVTFVQKVDMIARNEEMDTIMKGEM